jgi:signal transduction histidine kinase
MTMELAERGPVLDVPPDPSHDEIGDLSRAFATMQERLREQEQARRTFVATASHELRTPLASLRLILESVAEDLEHPDADLEDAREQLDRGRVQSERLARLAAELLDLSRIDAAVPLRSEPLELGELARAVIAEFEARASHDEASIELHAQSPCWTIADPGGVARIVRILVDNALRHGGGDEVTVTVAHDGTRASVSVQDRGPGIPESDRELVFERFHRGAAANRVPGFGLGLAIGRELARTMGGDLAIADSPPPGALFVLSLSAAAESELPLRPPEEPVAAGEL